MRYGLGGIASILVRVDSKESYADVAEGEIKILAALRFSSNALAAASCNPGTTW